MPKFRSIRLMLLAFLLSLVPASSFAGVFISVGFAPPTLPVYDVPPCPEPGWMWTPGFWSYGPDGYYWVPGAWVPTPYEGALWTPGYWGWGDGAYMWHPGYWGQHVGYYGGVNYGGGYLGIGFVGGEWHGHDFAYNTAVMRVGPGIHNTYMNRTIIENHIVVNNHVAFSGGPGGINHMPGAEERMAMHDQHMAPTSFQSNHQSAAMGDRGNYFRNNGGRPSNAAMARPLGFSGGNNGGARGSFGGGQQQNQMRNGGSQPQNQLQNGGNRGGAQNSFGGAQEQNQQRGGQSQFQGGNRQTQQQGQQQGQQRGGFTNQMRSSGAQNQQQSGNRGGSQPQAQGGGNHGGAQPQAQSGGNHGGGQPQAQHGGGDHKDKH